MLGAIIGDLAGFIYEYDEFKSKEINLDRRLEVLYKSNLIDSKGESMGNGALMRVSPVGYLFESESFEDVVRMAVSLGGDTDTIGAITGSLAEAYYEIPNDLKEKALAKLPDDFVLKLELGYQKVKKL